MKLGDLFQSKRKYATVKLYKKEEAKEESSSLKTEAEIDGQTEVSEKPKKKMEVYDEKIWMKCTACEDVMLIKDYEANSRVCTSCGFHGRLDARKRIETVIDDGSFSEYGLNISTVNPLGFPDYEEKIDKAKQQSGIDEAVVTGEGKINGIDTTIAVMDSAFMMGSMGSVVGEKITRMVEAAIEKRLPVIIFCASGGARMQEGILSLMQMAKTSAALAKLDDAGLPYISVLTDPTTGGVTASFAMLGDIILAEPKALVAFAGPRVIEQTIKQKLPEGFQRSEFLVEKGFVDKIVDRHSMKSVLGDILKMHPTGGERDE